MKPSEHRKRASLQATLISKFSNSTYKFRPHQGISSTLWYHNPQLYCLACADTTFKLGVWDSESKFNTIHNSIKIVVLMSELGQEVGWSSTENHMYSTLLTHYNLGFSGGERVCKTAHARHRDDQVVRSSRFGLASQSPC